ncbi:GAF domain-containing SpoIIE family protein phosphatase [Kitasatospora herbaricolor]|uniref:SpoIIE family protein phosphatase n=1 Tax=Kitasatospora herbaricolor TaxID=68217 RepID=A0ABZ1W2U4_9ACTN|nr:GAF domain-containing SpoIIE family protein phosphatase [Kitasatospora herbaricolor]
MDERPRVTAPLPSRLLTLDSDLNRLSEQLKELARAQGRMGGLLEAVLAISRELELSVVLRRIVTTAMELVGARYGALGVLDEDGRELADFIPVGLDGHELAQLAGVELPLGRGLLGHLIDHPKPLRVDELSAHRDSAGFPAGHPPMRTLLGVAITVRGRVYGNLYLTDKHGGKPFDADDEAVVTALAGAAGVAIENARLYGRLRAGAEQFQRLLLPRLPDLAPLSAWAVYQPAAEPALLGGDWYDALVLPDGGRAMVVGDVVGHDVAAAAAMSQVRNMLQALIYDDAALPSGVLGRLDRTLHALPEVPMATACLARFDRQQDGWAMRWSNAGHPPPLLVTPDGRARYLDGPPDVPLGVDTAVPRFDHLCPLPAGATVVMFTDGLVEHPRGDLDEGLRSVAAVAAALADRPVEQLGRRVAEARPGDGHDDVAVLALRIPSSP